MPDQKTMQTRCLDVFLRYMATKTFAFSSKNKDFPPQKQSNLARNWHCWSFWVRPSRSSKSPHTAHMCGGPKQVWGDQRAGGPENLLALRAEGTRDDQAITMVRKEVSSTPGPDSKAGYHVGLGTLGSSAGPHCLAL